MKHAHAMVLAAAGTLLTVAGTRAGDMHDVFREVHRRILEAHAEVLKPHLAVHAAVRVPEHFCPGKLPSRYRRHERHVCQLVRVRVWVPGHYEERVERRPTRHICRRYCRPSCSRRPVSYRTVIVKEWVPGRYETRWQKDPDCPCRHGRRYAERPRAEHHHRMHPEPLRHPCVERALPEH